MKVSIVTPTHNSSRFLNETIESIIKQRGNFEIEYFIVDYASTDRTIEIVKEYIALIENKSYQINCNNVIIKLISVKSKGMYHAINHGFAAASGDVFAWLNSDDVYAEGAFSLITSLFESLPQVQWVKGITSYIDEHSQCYEQGKCYIYDNCMVKSGFYGKHFHFIQQDSVFWRSSLWKKINGIDESLMVAGDYYLWTSFSKHADLYSVNFVLSFFRKVEGQLSSDTNKYMDELNKIYNKLPKKLFFNKLILNKNVMRCANNIWLFLLFYYVLCFLRLPKYKYIEIKNNEYSTKEKYNIKQLSSF